MMHLQWNPFREAVLIDAGNKVVACVEGQDRKDYLWKVASEEDLACFQNIYLDTITKLMEAQTRQGPLLKVSRFYPA